MLKTTGKFFKEQNPWLVTAFVLAAIFLVVYFLWVLIVGINSGLRFGGYAADGSFQIYNPLRRLDAGQVIGRDFQFFHGLGIPLLFYPFFKLLGANIFANEFCKWIIPVSAFVITAFFFFVASLKTWIKGVIALALFLMLLIPTTGWTVNNIVTPGNSMLGLRSAMSMIVAGILALNIRSHIGLVGLDLSLKRTLIITALALTFFISTEQGIYSILGYALYLVVSSYIDRGLDRKVFINIGIDLLIICILIVVFFSTATLGHPFKPLNYYLKILPTQQFWYFGTPPNIYLNWHNIGSFTLKFYKFFVVLGLSAILYLWAYRLKLINKLTRNSIIFLVSYGFLSVFSILGYTDYFQLAPFIKALIAVAIILSFKIFTHYTGTHGSHLKLDLKSMATSLVYGVYVILAVFCTTIYWLKIEPYHYVESLKMVPTAIKSTDSALTDKASWATFLSAFPELKSIKQGQLWSTYTSLYESSHGIFNPSKGGFDYIIHALGQTNFSAYVEQFTEQKSIYVLTLRPRYFMYEQWLWTSNWPFYKQLLSNYKIVSKNDAHYLWQYTGDDLNEKGNWRKLPVKNQVIYLPTTNRPMLLEIRVNYSATTPAGVLQKLPRYIIKPHDTGLVYGIALPPYQTEQSFIVPIFAFNKNPQLQAKADGLMPGAKLELRSVEYREFNTDPVNYQPFVENHADVKPL